MPARFTLDADGLARLRVALGREARSLRAVTFRLDSEGLALGVTLPGPDYLAVLLDLDGLDVARRGPVLVARPNGSEEEPEVLALPALADSLRETLAALPDRPDAGEAYLDLRVAAGTSSARFADYLLDVVRSYRNACPAEVRPKVSRRPSTAPSRTPAERERDRRAAWKAEEVATIRHVLARWRESGALTPGRYAATDLYEKARTAVERAVAAGVTMPDGSPFADYFGSRTFYAVADEVLGSRKRTKHGYVYTVVRKVARFMARLSAMATEALRRSGIEEPETYADEAVREVLDRAPASRPQVLDPRVLALPRNVAFAVAGAAEEDVVWSFGLMAREHLSRHPEDRPAVVAVALALRAGDPDGLVPQIRALCADALLAEERDAAGVTA